MTRQTRRRSQTVGRAPLNHTQNISDENVDQISLATHGSTNTQSPSADQNGTKAIQPRAGLNSE